MVDGSIIAVMTNEAKRSLIRIIDKRNVKITNSTGLETNTQRLTWTKFQEL